MKYGTFLIIEACEKLGFPVVINKTDKIVTITDVYNDITYTFSVINVDNFTKEFYENSGRIKYRNQSISAYVHKEIKELRKDPHFDKRWNTIRLRNSNLAQLLG
jgi:hypothetical protein